MSLSKLFLQQTRLAASVGVILLSAFLTSAKTGHSPVSPTTPPTEKILNLSEFNPVGNGVADDGPAIQKALDALADAGGGTLLIPAGSFRIATPVVKDFSSVPGAKVTIQGVPSTKMPAPVTAAGEQLAASLDLTSEIIPATGAVQTAITLSNLDQVTIEHVVFTGIETSWTDAFITLYFIDIGKATVRHCEFYGISTFGVITELGGGNVIRALRSELSIELTVFLGCTANSGAYGPLVENMEWKGFSISNSIFLDYGIRSFYSKTGLGAPLSWIGLEHAAVKTPESPRREVIVRDTFLDEGGWVGISVLPYRWAAPPPPIDLIYISGLKMNVCNMGMTGHLIYDVRNVLIENSHYGWSNNAYAAIDFNRVENAILDQLTLIDHADRIRADSLTGRLTVINSLYNGIDSEAATTTLLETEPDAGPVQYVRTQFSNALGRSPDPAAHLYWSDLLIRCGSNNDCVNEKRAALSEYLSRNPKETFSLAGTVTDENGDPLSGASISLTGSETLGVVTDSQGKFRFSGLPTSGSYTVAGNKRHYSFTKSNQLVIHPAADITADFNARLNRHSITGRILKADGTGQSGVSVQLAELPTNIVTTDADGFYSFSELAAGQLYTVVPSSADLLFHPLNITIEELASDETANFVADEEFHSLTVVVKDDNGDPLSDVNISLSGSKSAVAVTDSQGSFRFSGLPTSGSYTVAVGRRHYSFTPNILTITRPTSDVSVIFDALLHRHSITGRLTRNDGTGMSGVAVQLVQFPTTSVTTDANGVYSFTQLMAGETYTVVPAANNFVFGPVSTTFEDLGADRVADFVGKLEPELMMINGSEFALALDAVSFITEPFSLLNSFGLNSDGFMRVMLFATNLEPVSGPSQVSVVAKDDTGQTHSLEVEYFGEIPGQSWLKQINIKVPSSSLSGKCVELKVTVAGVSSNDARICLGKS
jgi:protocatechuate 3,4-dioxygenase beta subunit